MEEKPSYCENRSENRNLKVQRRFSLKCLLRTLLFLLLEKHSSLPKFINSSALCSPHFVPSSSPCSSQDSIFSSQMAPKRSREVTTEVSPARPRSKPRVSQLPSIAAAPELFSSEVNFRRYSEFFHGRDLVVGRRFNLSTLTAIGLLFEEKLI